MENYIDSTLPKNENGDPVLTLDEPGEDEGSIGLYDDTDPNLVEHFALSEEGREELEEIGKKICDMFDEDWEGQASYRKRWAKDVKLLMGDLPKKKFPFEWSANCHVPIMLENMTRLACRIESEMFGDWAQVLSVPPVGEDSENLSEILTIHGNWQIREQIPDFERQMQRALMMFLMGDVCCRSDYDTLTELNRHVALSPDEFVTPYTFVSTMPDYGDLPHYTEILRYYRHQLQAQKGKWYGVDEVLKGNPSWEDEPDAPGREALAKVQGEEAPAELSKGAPCVMLQWEGWLELPLQTRDRWVQAIVDYHTKRIVSLKIHEEADWQDRIRFEQQTSEMAGYVAAKGQHQAALQQIAQHAQETQAMHAAGQVGPMQATEMVNSLSEAVPPPPPAPPWLADPEDLAATPDKPKTRPILMYSHGVCQEPLLGSLGIGVGRVLADYNRAANIALSQFTDQATLGNAKGVIVADTVDFERPFSWAPGKINKAKGVGPAELASAVRQFELGPANPQLVQLVQLMQANGQAAAQAPDVLSGDPGKSGETYRGIATRIEQATKQLTVVGRRFAQFVKNVLKNNAKLNAVFLKDEEIIMVTRDAASTMEPMVINRSMYQRDYKVEIRSDMKFSGDAERVATADQIAQMCLAFPPLMQDLPFMYQAIKGSLEARHQRKLVPYLGPDPGIPMMPFGAAPMPQPPGGGAPPGGPPPPGHGAGTAPQGQDNGPPPNNPQGPGGPAPGPPPPQPEQAAA